MSLNNDEKTLEERVEELEREMSKLQGLVEEFSAETRTMWGDVREDMEDMRKQINRGDKEVLKSNSKVLEILALPVHQRAERLREMKKEDNNQED